MSATATPPAATPPFALHEAGHPDVWAEFEPISPHAPGRPVKFLKDALGLTAMECSVGELHAGSGLPFVHRHRRNEELYVIFSGHGDFQADGRSVPVGPGSCVRCAPEVRRSLRSVGDEPLRFLCVQAPAGGYGGGSTIDDGEIVDEPLVWRE